MSYVSITELWSMFVSTWNTCDWNWKSSILKCKFFNISFDNVSMINHAYYNFASQAVNTCTYW